MEGSKLMGILDDVTHAGDEPVVEKTYPVAFLECTDEELTAIKAWLESAPEDKKDVVVDGPVTKTFYSHARVDVRPIFEGFREKIAAHYDKDMVYLKKYYTIAFSNAEEFEYENHIYAGHEDVVEPVGEYHFGLVLDGTLKTNVYEGKTLYQKDAYCVLTEPRVELISKGGDEDSLILCFTLSNQWG